LTRVDEKVKNCILEKSSEILLRYYNKSVFSASSLAVSRYGDDGFSDCYNAAGSSADYGQFSVDEDSVFDLASLTKPLVTLPAVLLLIEEQVITWNEPLYSLLETDLPARFEGVDLQGLLCHNAGFPAHRNFWEHLITIESGRRKKWLLKAVLEAYPGYEPGQLHRYSDLGYILLGFIVEKKTGRSLDSYWRDKIAEPAGVEESLFFASQIDSSKKGACITTGHCRWSGQPLTGMVHDDNCRALGGVAGHAGLFGTSRGVLELCKRYLDIYHGRSSRLTLSGEIFCRACLPVGDGVAAEWSRGFNRPSTGGSSSGSLFSSNSIGHLGFTGVSFWIDLDKEIVVCLLTNRVLKGDNPDGIRVMRPELHDTVMLCMQQ
jgi:CubicO group peptidase (beta-lactamase class C family)